MTFAEILLEISTRIKPKIDFIRPMEVAKEYLPSCMINELLLNMGVIDKPIAFLNEKNYFWGILTTSNIWKDVGWSAIIYISAIAGVDGTLYEAGSVDGLGRFGKAWHITLPGIAPTVIMLFIMGIGGILNAGFEQQLLIGNPLTQEVYENIDTYVYRYGMQLGRALHSDHPRLRIVSYR